MDQNTDKGRIYHVTGYLYVPLDGEILASSKKEAAKKWKEFCSKQTTGFDFQPRIHEVLLESEPQTDVGQKDEFGEIIRTRTTVNSFIF